ncbi:dienelactone hydrolase family protein [Sphingomonas jaspsi]|uniref:dienelactone hydrolase family protein n=1 Tax=Sphingomonas jaspsi TaxID=392409 RepID=UPI0004AD5557|nr:dienelactone hydrolase family protein [Sphingomonas jaspsi]
MNDRISQEAIDLYDRFTHDGMDRRDFIARMTAIAGSAAAAELMIAAIAASPAAAALVAEGDPRIKAQSIQLPLPGIPTYRAYRATPVRKSGLGTVIVIHENRGLNDHIRDVTRRLAVAGFPAIAPDFLSPLGGTPSDENVARDMIGKLDLGQSVSHAVAHLKALKKATGKKVGTVGFCWGGAFVDRLAVAAGRDLSAAVSYYGPAPDPREAVKVQAPMLLHYADLDTRVAQTGKPWVAALKAASKKVEVFDYPGVNHAFNNDTSAERYNKAAADLAWKRTLAFFRANLK